MSRLSRDLLKSQSNIDLKPNPLVRITAIRVESSVYSGFAATVSRDHPCSRGFFLEKKPHPRWARNGHIDCETVLAAGDRKSSVPDYKNLRQRLQFGRHRLHIVRI
jgi:hypothetical protein